MQNWKQHEANRSKLFLQNWKQNIFGRNAVSLKGISEAGLGTVSLKGISEVSPYAISLNKSAKRIEKFFAKLEAEICKKSSKSEVNQRSGIGYNKSEISAKKTEVRFLQNWKQELVINKSERNQRSNRMQ